MLDEDFYRGLVQGTSRLSVEDLARHYVEIGERSGHAPGGLFDPAYYMAINTDLVNVDSPLAHYIAHGRQEGRQASLASHLIATSLDEVAIEEGLIPAPAVGPRDPGYPSALALALRAIDRDPDWFSAKFYLERYPDLVGHPVHPLMHYLQHGRHEGRVTNVSLMAGIHFNTAVLAKGRPFTLVGVHEASKTGAPIVGLDLAREMQGAHNVIFVSLRDGPLIETARALFPVVITASHLDEDNRFFADYVEQKYAVNEAIFSSSACIPFIRTLASKNCRITCLVHEFLEYMIHAVSVIYICDLLVFSSKQLLKSWQYMLDDLGRDPATVMVLPQPASSVNARTMPKAEARAAVSAATGLDLDGAILVLGAGQVQIRKGTDIFLQVGNQLQRESGKFVSVWIGEQVSAHDMGYGVWLHAQIERSRGADGTMAVHFEPAGPLYPLLMDAADVFLVTSRLDPLPNVALDAASRDLPVIAFAGATGLADLAESGEIDLIEVEIGAIDEVVAAIKGRFACVAA
ncbi:glycosyltransferase [Novosphingobium sp. FKTRR1]|uniref:glycosyltransferase n=1 Tax=Novosphingobium sp. FKTRR1 TaxID=2879118 RepID=UPI001CF02BC2|nr:glycosyltransferase [Novosphingobium sp. FKTRR1]